MKPQDELNYLSSFIKLAKDQAIKRDSLERFLLDKSKTLILDADSLLFNAVHGCTDEDFDLDQNYTSFIKQVNSIIDSIESDGFFVDSVVYCFTTCKNNFRKDLLPSYKANRKPNDTTKLVRLLRTYAIQRLEESEDVRYDDIFEADDLAAEAMRSINNGILASIDKDMLQVEGAHFNYYKDKVKDDEGNIVIDRVESESGEVLFLPRKKFRGWSYTTKNEGFRLLMHQLLVGDNSDNIKGALGIGDKKAEKLLNGKSKFGMLRAVYEAYSIPCIKDLTFIDFWQQTTPAKYKKHKGEKVLIYEKNRLKLNISLMKL